MDAIRFPFTVTQTLSLSLSLTQTHIEMNNFFSFFFSFQLRLCCVFLFYESFQSLNSYPNCMYRCHFTVFLPCLFTVMSYVVHFYYFLWIYLQQYIFFLFIRSFVFAYAAVYVRIITTMFLVSSRNGKNSFLSLKFFSVENTKKKGKWISWIRLRIKW